jgi:hypothetical protein
MARARDVETRVLPVPPLPLATATTICLSLRAGRRGLL